MESILTSIKKLLGITEDYTHFDADIIMHINSAISVLTQLGVGPDEGYRITSAEDTWSDFIGDDPRFDMVKTYVFQKVRLMFDPPVSSSATEAAKNAIAEFEWRLNVATEK